MFGRKKTIRNDKSIVMPQMPVETEPEETGHITRKVPQLTTLVFTSVGNRKYQQDSLYPMDKQVKILSANKKTRVLAMVCDGMGGMADGGRASRTAIQMMATGFSKVEKYPELNIPMFFRQGIVAIDRTIASFPKENGKGSGTTMVACIVENDQLYTASVGDSRIYYIHGSENRMELLTEDHNYWLRLMQMVQAGQITMEQARASKHKEALISFLGIGNVSLMDIRTIPIQMKYGDVVMLCSDGITKTLPKEQIQFILQDGGRNYLKPEQKAQALVDAATHANSHSQDNTSVVLIRYEEVDVKKAGR